MPTDKDFKQLVRQRMAGTGERYTEARAALAVIGDRPLGATNGSLTATGWGKHIGESWVQLLCDPQQNQEAFRRLKELPPDELLPLALAGTRDPNPKVRRRSCQLLDDLALTPDSVAALELCTADPDPRVRGAALHTLACEHCKPNGVCIDRRLIAERAASDRSAKLRRGVAMGLSWNPKDSDAWAVALATRLVADRSSEVRRYAQAALDRIEGQRRTDAERRQLPEPLRTKTERHPGKWVAVENGQIVAVDPGPTWRRRHHDARLYFVTPRQASA